MHTVLDPETQPEQPLDIDRSDRRDLTVIQVVNRRASPP